TSVTSLIVLPRRPFLQIPCRRMRPLLQTVKRTAEEGPVPKDLPRAVPPAAAARRPQVQDAGVDPIEVGRHGAGGEDGAREVERAAVAGEGRVELVVGGVDGGSEVPWLGPHIVAQEADVEVAPTVAAGPERGEQEDAAVGGDLGVELPVGLRPGRIERQARVDGVQALAGCEAAAGGL